MCRSCWHMWCHCCCSGKNRWKHLPSSCNTDWHSSEGDIRTNPSFYVMGWTVSKGMQSATYESAHSHFLAIIIRCWARDADCCMMTVACLRDWGMTSWLVEQIRACCNWVLATGKVFPQQSLIYQQSLIQMPIMLSIEQSELCGLSRIHLYVTFLGHGSRWRCSTTNFPILHHQPRRPQGCYNRLHTFPSLQGFHDWPRLAGQIVTWLSRLLLWRLSTECPRSPSCMEGS